MFDIALDDVAGHYWKGLTSFRTAFSHGEPVAQHPGVGDSIVTWLVERGLLEIVDNPQYGHHPKPCYRLTNLGYAVIERGQRAQPARKRPPIKMLKSRVATLDFRTVKPSR